MVELRYAAEGQPEALPRLQYRYREISRRLNQETGDFSVWSEWTDVPLVVLPPSDRAAQDT